MAEKEPRLSHQALKVLSVFMEHAQTELAGSDVWRETKMLSGTVYPILMRLERARWLESKWEELDPSEAGRPRKRLYRLTPKGYNNASKVLAELGASIGRLAWNS